MAEGENLISVLMTDHREVEEMFTELESAGLPAQRRAELRDKVITELVRHSVAEEMYLYPTTRTALPGGDQLADREIEEHAAAERVMKDLEKVDPDDARLDDLGMSARRRPTCSRGCRRPAPSRSWPSSGRRCSRRRSWHRPGRTRRRRTSRR